MMTQADNLGASVGSI